MLVVTMVPLCPTTRFILCLTPHWGWAIFRLEYVEEQRERRKTKAEEGKDKEEEGALKHEKPPPFRWGCFMTIFGYKTPFFLRFLT